MNIQLPPQLPVGSPNIFYVDTQHPTLSQFPLLNSLIHAAHNKYSFYQWIRLIPKSILQWSRKPFLDRKDKQNLDLTATAVYFMTLDQSSDVVEASEEHIIEVIDEIELALFVELLNRARGIHIHLNEKHGLNRNSFYRWSRKASLSILKTLRETQTPITEILFDSIENYLKPPRDWYPKRDK
jgi:hypothetical protein